MNICYYFLYIHFANCKALYTWTAFVLKQGKSKGHIQPHKVFSFTLGSTITDCFFVK